MTGGLAPRMGDKVRWYKVEYIDKEERDGGGDGGEGERGGGAGAEVERDKQGICERVQAQRFEGGARWERDLCFYLSRPLPRQSFTRSNA